MRLSAVILGGCGLAVIAGPALGQTSGDLPIEAILEVQSSTEAHGDPSIAACLVEASSVIANFGKWHRPRGPRSRSLGLDPVDGSFDSDGLVRVSNSADPILANATVVVTGSGPIRWDTHGGVEWPTQVSKDSDETMWLNLAPVGAWRRTGVSEWKSMPPLLSTWSWDNPLGRDGYTIFFRFGGTISGIENATAAGLYRTPQLTLRFTC